VPDAEPESPADWPPEVGCVAVEAPDRFLFVDPLVPADRGEAFWVETDQRVKRHGRPVSVFTTIPFHRRSSDEIAARYRGAISAGADRLSVGVEPIPIERADKTMLWLSDHRALVPGDRLIGDGRGGLRLCPESWLGYLENGLTEGDLRARLRSLLDLPVELVLVSHGEPVLAGAAEALAAAIDPA
jgi:hypothetical protein